MQEDVFAAVLRHIGTDCDWQPFAGGSSNQLFRAEVAGEAQLLRVNAPDVRVPGVDRAREAVLLQKLQGRQWAPNLRGCDPQVGWLLMDWHGEEPASPLTPALRQQLLQAVADWQRLEVSNATIDYPALFDHYRQQLLGLPLSKALLQLIELLEQSWEGLPAVPQVLTHHDLHPGNLCEREGRLVVVDWEYGAIGNPWFDAAALSKDFDASLGELSALPAFAEIDADALAGGLGRACWMLETLECLWYWARGLSGSGRDMAWLMRETLRLLKTAA